jgi:hypothetical protein
MIVALVVQDGYPAEMATEEGQKAGSIDFAQEEDRKVADIDWSVGQREKDIGSAEAQGEVDSPDLAGKSLGPGTGY